MGATNVEAGCIIGEGIHRTKKAIGVRRGSKSQWLANPARA